MDQACPSSPATKASADHHGTLSGGSLGLPCACASEFRGQGWILPAEVSDQAHIQGSICFQGSELPLFPFTWEASSKFAIGMSASAFIKKGQF